MYICLGTSCVRSRLSGGKTQCAWAWLSVFSPWKIYEVLLGLNSFVSVFQRRFLSESDDKNSIHVYRHRQANSRSESSSFFHYGNSSNSFPLFLSFTAFSSPNFVHFSSIDPEQFPILECSFPNIVHADFEICYCSHLVDIRCPRPVSFL